MNARVWALALGAGLLLPGATRAEDAPAVSLGGPWYVSVSGGASLRETQSGATPLAERTNVGTVTASGKQTEAFDPGLVAALAVGTHPLPLLLPGLRTELELGYVSYAASYVAPVSVGIAVDDGRHFNLLSGGIFERETATFNGFYDVPLGAAATPYVGGGFGYAHGSGGAGLFLGSGGKFRTGTPAGGTRNSGLAIVEAGIAFDLGQGWSVVPAYRYMRFVGDSDRYGDEATHVIKLGVRRSF